MLEKKITAYLRYLKQEIALNEHYKLDITQIRVLNFIAFSHFDRKTIKIGDVLLLNSIASQATIHAALKKLRRGGFIELQTINETRAKYISLTEEGINRYNELATAMFKHAK